MRYLLIAVLVACSLTAHAEPPSLLITDGGYFLLTVDESGRPIVQDFSRVVTLGKPPTPVPPTNPAPPSTLSAKARGWAAAVPESLEKPLVQRGIATSLRIVGESVSRMRSVEEAETLLRELIRATIPEAHKVAWLPFGQSLMAELDARKKGLTVTQYGQLLVEIAKGLE